jgi:Zn-dependent protease with chaperone function
LALILGVPLIGFAVSSGIRAHFDSELRAAAIKQVPDADRTKIAALTVAQLCETPDTDTADMCQTDANLGVMRTASLASGVVGLGLLSLIAFAGLVAQSNRTLLLWLFRPGLYFTAFAITGLILAHAIIAIAVIYYGESALVNRIHFGIILAIGLGAIAGVAAVARSAFGIVQKAETIAIGKAVSFEEAKALWHQAAQVAQKLGALRPDHIVIGLDPTFFVTEANVVTLSGKLTGRTLFCSLPLARILTIDEFSAIIGHELGHFRGEDTKFSERFYPIYRGTTTAIESLQTAGGEGWGVLALLPAIAVFSFFLERFAVAENRHSRTRELLADMAGSEATSQRTMASALVKVHAFAGIWDDFQRAWAEALQEGKVYTNASAVFAEAVANSANSAALEGIADTHTSHPTDSHPPLAVRLASLKVELPSVAAAALTVNLDRSAASLIPEAEAQEEALSETYQLLLARRLGIEPKAEEPKGEQSGVSPIRRCGACGTRVMPKQDGHCPSCGVLMDSATSPRR